MSRLTQEQERQLIDDFKNGEGTIKLSLIYDLPTREVEHILRQEALRLEKEGKK